MAGTARFGVDGLGDDFALIGVEAGGHAFGHRIGEVALDHADGGVFADLRRLSAT